jgi:hypothetical protein
VQLAVWALILHTPFAEPSVQPLGAVMVYCPVAAGVAVVEKATSNVCPGEIFVIVLPDVLVTCTPTDPTLTTETDIGEARLAVPFTLTCS